MRNMDEAIVIKRHLRRVRMSIAVKDVHDRGSYVEVWFYGHSLQHGDFIKKHSRLMLSIRGARIRVSLKMLEQFADFCDALATVIRVSSS